MNYEECRDGHGRPGVFRRWFHHGCASRESLNGLVEGGRIETEFVEVFGLVCHGPSALVHLGLEDHLSDGQTVPHEPHGSVTNTETDTKNRPNFSIMEGQSELGTSAWLTLIQVLLAVVAGRTPPTTLPTLPELSPIHHPRVSP